MSVPRGHTLWWPALAAAVLAAPSCSSVPPPSAPAIRGGHPDRGRLLIEQYGCGSCHTVPGVRGADGLVGPPLTRFGSRSYIAGELPNNADNLRQWIRDPHAVEPGTAMPDLDVTELDGRDIAAYLYTLD
jgi:cytochrome c1